MTPPDPKAIHAVTTPGHPDAAGAARALLAEPALRGLATVALARVGTADDVSAIDAAGEGLIGKDQLRQQLAATLIRARFGLALPAIQPPRRLDIAASSFETEELHFGPARDKAALDAKRFLDVDALGFEPGEPWALRTEPWTRNGCRAVVIPNAEVLRDPVRRTERAPAVVACLARYDMEVGRPVLDLWVVSRPHGEGALLTVHSAGGFLFFTGQAQADGPALRFAISTADEHPMRPVAVGGRIGPGGRLEEATARRATRWKSRATPLRIGP